MFMKALGISADTFSESKLTFERFRIISQRPPLVFGTLSQLSKREVPKFLEAGREGKRNQSRMTGDGTKFDGVPVGF